MAVTPGTAMSVGVREVQSKRYLRTVSADPLPT